MDRIGVIIRTYNEAEFLPRTLNAIIEQAEQFFEIVLVDSESTDETVDIARRYDRIRIIEIKKKDFTYGRALNIGISTIADKVEYIVMLSAHAIPANRLWLTEILEPMRHDPKVVGIYGKQIPLQEHLSYPLVCALVADSYPKSYGDTPIITNESHFFSNANGAIRSSSWKKNRFNEFLPFCEDQGWAITALQSGGWIAYQPTAVVYHSPPYTFWDYFIRTYKEAMALRMINPSSFALLGKKQSLLMIKDSLVAYARACICRKSLVGPHWNQCRVRIVRTLAIYQGRKDARIR